MIVYEDVCHITLNVNGEARSLTVRPADTLLRVLREKLGLTGPRFGCENGDCWACTVLIDGEPLKSCLVLAVEVEGHKHEITTIEGLADTPIQEAFLSEAGFQCGYCTPGFLLAAHALLRRHPQPTDEQIRVALAGNLCRCTGYEGIEQAVRKAAEPGGEKVP
jgi:carbon-monoxide dehydrogenase small subunit